MRGVSLDPIEEATWVDQREKEVSGTVLIRQLALHQKFDDPMSVYYRPGVSDPDAIHRRGTTA